VIIGGNAGVNNQASGNVFIGYQSGITNTFASNNTFVGNGTGANNTGTGNTFLGTTAGSDNTTASFNTFVGSQAGLSNTIAQNNAFFGFVAGTVSTGQNNTYIGAAAANHSTSAQNCTFLGYSTGVANITGGSITLLGSAANVSADGLTQATAIGANSIVTTNNMIQLGQAGTDSVNVGKQLSINTTQLTDNHGHIVSGSGTPGVAGGLGGGTSSPAPSIVGTDISGTLSLTTTTTPAASSTIATVTFSLSYGVAPRVILTPGNAATAALVAAEIPFVSTTSTTNFVIESNTTGIAATTAYQWYYMVAS